MTFGDLFNYCQQIFVKLCNEADNIMYFLTQPVWNVINASDIFGSGIGAFLLTILNAITNGNIVGILTNNSLIDLMFGTGTVILLGFIVVRSLVNLFK